MVLSRRTRRNIALIFAVSALIIAIFETTESPFEKTVKAKFEQTRKNIDSALQLTEAGKRRHIQWRKNAVCNEKHEPRWFKFWARARHLKTCVSYDLSLRRKPLGDNGVKALTKHLSGRLYANSKKERRLNKLYLARQGITRRGAGYLARWLSPLGGTFNATAISPYLEINLEGNPIALSGKQMLERAVDEARLNGVSVTIYGGGPCVDPGGKGGLVIKLGPLEASTPIVEMERWQIPAPRSERYFGWMHRLSWQVIVALFVGLTLGQAIRTRKGTSYLEHALSYRPAMVHRDHIIDNKTHFDGIFLT